MQIHIRTCTAFSIKTERIISPTLSDIQFYAFRFNQFFPHFHVIDVDRLTDKIRNIEGIYKTVIIFKRPFLRQHERLCYLPISIHPGNIKISIQPIVPTGTENKPMRVTAPVMGSLHQSDRMSAFSNHTSTNLLLYAKWKNYHNRIK